MSSTHKTQTENSAPTRSHASSFRLFPLLLIGLLLVGTAWWLRSSRWLHEYIVRSKDLPELETLVRSQPEDALAQYYLAKSYYLNRRFSEARSAYEEAARLDPDSARVHLGLALSLYELGESDSARREFERALRLDPRSAWAEYMLGKLAWADENVEEALAHLRRATERDPRSDQAWYGLAVCYTEQRRYNEAIEALQKAVARRDTSAKYQTALGELLVYRGQVDEGRQHYERALRLNPNYGPTCALLGKFLLENASGPDSLDRAEELLQRATRLKAPRPAEVYFYLGQLYVRKAQYKKAVEALQESIRLDALDERAYYALANSYHRMGDTKMAAATERRFQSMSKQHVLLQSLEARVYHDSNDLVSRLHLARLCREMGLTEQAANHYRAYLRLLPNATGVAREFEQLIDRSAGSEANGSQQDFVLKLPHK